MRVIFRWVPRLVVQIILRILGIRCQSFQSKKCVWIVLHIYIGALEQLVWLDVVYQWIESTSSTVYISVCRYYLLSDNTTPLCIMSPDKISVMSPSHMTTLYQINSNSPRRRVGWLLNRTIRSWVRQCGFLTTTITPSHAATFSTRFWCTAAHRSYYKLRNYLHNFFNNSDASEFSLSTLPTVFLMTSQSSSLEMIRAISK